MNLGLVSVIIPTHNRATLVLRAIASALAQTYKEIEILVIDDGSTDGTLERVQQLYQSNCKVRYLSKPNGGVSSARNLGLREARGDFVAFLDADDTWLPGKLEIQLLALKRLPGAGMIWTEMAALHPDGSVAHARYLRKMYDNYRYFPTASDLFAKDLVRLTVDEIDIYCGDIFSPMVLGNVVHTSTVLMRRDRLEQVGFFDEMLRTGEDYPFHLRTCKVGLVAYADVVTTSYAIDLPDALTTPEKRIQMSLSFLQLLQFTLRTEKARVSLPPSLIQARLSDAYAWAGNEHLLAGKRGEARAYFLQSLRAKPGDFSRMKGLAKTILPTQTRSLLTALKRKKPLRGLSQERS